MRSLHSLPTLREAIVVVTYGDHCLPFDELPCYWIFDPHTRHPWPSGDFIDRRTHEIFESAWSYAELMKRHDVIRYDTDMMMDTGL